MTSMLPSPVLLTPAVSRLGQMTQQWTQGPRLTLVILMGVTLAVPILVLVGVSLLILLAWELMIQLLTLPLLLIPSLRRLKQRMLKPTH